MYSTKQLTFMISINAGVVSMTFNPDLIRIVMFMLFVQNGPMVPGVAPREASDRLIIFQNRFDTLFRKYNTYTGQICFRVEEFRILWCKIILFC